MSLNTWVAGNPGAMRAYARQVHTFDAGTDEVAAAQHRVRGEATAEWEGPAGEAFQGWANQQGRGGNTLAELFQAVGHAVEVWADEIDTVKARMEQAKQVAREGELAVLADAILPPKPVTARPPVPIPERASAGEKQAQADAAAQFEAAQALHAKREAAFAEAHATVTDARGRERAAHEKLVTALNGSSADLAGMPQTAAWEQAGAHPASAAGAALSHAATVVESRATEATRGMFEHALHQGPAATRGMWMSLSEAQRGDLMARFPQMVGSADGLPTPVRHTANLSMLAGQRLDLQHQLRSVGNSIKSIRPGEGMAAEKQRLETRAEEIRQSLAGLDEVEQELKKDDDTYLLKIDATASDGRGQAIIARGNPDTASNVLTTVPGTYSDLGDAMNYVRNSDEVMTRAEQLAPGESFASITYAGYESPPSLPGAAAEKYADNGSADLSQFQEGLRVSHEGDTPSNNTVIGHSYGTTEVGYAARDHGLHADNIVFMGSPGVGVDEASQLGVPAEQVWSGTSDLDVIEYATPSPNPWDYGPDLETKDPFGPDHHWFGMDPSDPAFGARELPVRDWSFHSDYWKYDESLDGMARVVADQTGQPAQPKGQQ